jgi:putative ABC transport system permease protein
MDGFLQDLKFALRMLRKNASISAVAVLTLALAIGATTSIFSVVSAMLVRPLPFPHADQLVALQDVEPGVDFEHGFSWPEIEDLRAQAPDLTGLAAYTPAMANFTGRGEPQTIKVAQVSRGFFEVLSAAPVLGRSFSPEEHVENGAPVVVASAGFWHRALGEMRPGGTLLLDGVPHTLIGVASSATSAIWQREPPALWVPLERKLPFRDRGSHYLETVARLRPGVSLERAKADLAAAMPRIAEAAKSNHLASVQSLRQFLHGSATPLLILLLAAVALVLLIAAVNLANVVLSRATGRSREFAVRRALGASRVRLARQLLVENAVVGLLGGAIGVVLALWGRDLVLRTWPASLPRIDGGAPLDLRVLAFAIAISAATGLGIGLAPALDAGRGDLNAGLKEGAGATGRGAARAGLIVAQSALAVLLLVSAVLVLRSFSHMLRQTPGFRAEHVAVFRVNLSEVRYPDTAARARFFREVLDRISALPAVTAAGAADRVPLGGGGAFGDFSVVGRPPLDEKDQPRAEKRVVTPGYFSAMQIPLAGGRVFTDAEPRSTVVINQTLAKQVFPGEDPIGKQLRAGIFSDGRDEAAEIVGIVGDVKQVRLDKEATSEIYFPESGAGVPQMELVVRGGDDPMSLIGAVKAQIAAADPDQPVASVRTLRQVVDGAAAPQRVAASLLGAFALTAVLLAALGIYGVVSYGVSRREREIGVRMALGASAPDVLRMIVREGLRLALIGLAAGALLALASGRMLAAFLYGVSPADPATYAVAAAVLAAVSVAACWLPARRATKVDPAISLRAE